jgi:hypothetical protein
MCGVLARGCDGLLMSCAGTASTKKTRRILRTSTSGTTTAGATRALACSLARCASHVPLTAAAAMPSAASTAARACCRSGARTFSLLPSLPVPWTRCGARPCSCSCKRAHCAASGCRRAQEERSSCRPHHCGCSAARAQPRLHEPRPRGAAAARPQRHRSGHPRTLATSQPRTRARTLRARSHPLRSLSTSEMSTRTGAVPPTTRCGCRGVAFAAARDKVFADRRSGAAAVPHKLSTRQRR